MFRIDSPGATIDNLFTEGNPALGVAATTVSDDWLNAVQEELGQFIENQGVTLDKGDDTQLEEALGAFFAAGGGETFDISITNNQVSATDLTGVVFDKDDFIAVELMFHVARETATQNVIETGIMRCSYDSVGADWVIDINSSHDDSGMTFTITAAGQVQYASTDLTGGSYVGSFKATRVTKIAA